MSRALDDLDARFYPLACELIARCAEAHISVLIVDTLRTPAEQEANILRGVSWTRNSLHLPQLPEGKSLAIDVCPYSVYQLNGQDKLQWDVSDPVWQKIGAIGKALGLRWGGDWMQKDMGHFEYVRPPEVA